MIYFTLLAAYHIARQRFNFCVAIVRFGPESFVMRLMLALSLILGASAVTRGENIPIPQDPARMEKRAHDWLEWNRSTLRGAYDKVGKRDPRWDQQAHDALEFVAKTMSLQIDPIERSGWYAVVKKAIDAGCDDPLILYLYAKSSTGENYPEIAEFDKRVRAATDGMSASAYPPIRRAFAKMFSIEVKSRDQAFSPEDRRDLEKDLDDVIDYLSKSVAEDPRGEFWEARWFDILLEVIRNHRKLTLDVKATFDRLDDKLAKIQGIEALRLLNKGNFMLKWGWEARTKAFAPAVGEERFRVFNARVSEARSTLEEAWKLYPEEPRVACLMLEVYKSIGEGDRAVMELWFERAMKADGNDRGACFTKLDWLDPKWYGDPNMEDMMAFGKACAATKNWQNGITLLLGDSHQRYIEKLPVTEGTKHMKKPEVWAEIKTVFDDYLKHSPDDDVARSRYAVLSGQCGKFAEAHAQFEIVGDRLAVWPNFPYMPLEAMQQMRSYIARVIANQKK